MKIGDRSARARAGDALGGHPRTSRNLTGRDILATMQRSVALEVTLDSVDELAGLLEHCDPDDAQQRAWVAWHAQMLAYWAGILVAETPCYPALAAGVAEFAHRVHAWAAQTGEDGP